MKKNLLKSGYPSKHSYCAAVIVAAAAVAGLSPLGSSSAFAVTRVWNGATGGVWSLSTNWGGTGGTAGTPTTADALTILGPANVAGALTVNLTSASQAGSITITDTAAVTLNNTTSGANQTLTLGGAVAGLTTGTGAVTIGSATANQGVLIALGASQTWTVGTGGLTINNAISGAFQIRRDSAAAGTLVLNADNSGYAGLAAAIGGVTYTQGFRLNTGTTQIATATSLGSGVVDFRSTLTASAALIGANRLANTFVIGTGTGTIGGSNNIELGGAFISSSGAATPTLAITNTGTTTVSGTVSLSDLATTAKGLTVDVASTAGAATISGVIQNFTTAGSGLASGLTKTSAGLLTLSGANTYTGATAINAGTIQFAKINSMAASSATTVASGATLAVNAGGTGEVAVAGSGAGTVAGLLAGTGSQGSTLTMAAGSSIGIDTTNAAGTVTLASPYTSTNTVGLLKLGTGTLALTGGGAFTGIGAGGFPLIVRQGTTLLNGGTYTVNGEAVVGGTFGTANGAAGYDAKLQVDNGTVNVTGFLSVGRGNGIGGVSSDLVLNNASALTAANLSAGYNGGSASNLPKGSITLNNTSALTISGATFYLGESAGSNIALTVNDTASVTHTTGIMYVGLNAGSGTVLVNGGTLTNPGEIQVGGSSASGAANNGTGTFTLSSGTVAAGALTVARGNANTNLNSGLVAVNGGTLTSASDIILGYAGSGLGKLTINGGTVNVGTTAVKWLQLGVYDTAKGQVDITSGALKLNSSSAIRFNTQNTTGANVFNQNGGTVTFYGDNGVTVGGTGVLDMQQIGAAGSNNTYNLNGGTLTVPQILSAVTTGTRTFNFNGGNLVPTGSTAAFLNLGTGTARANVRDGGAKINTNGFDVTVAQALVHSNILTANPVTLTADAATDGGLAKSGAGTLTLSAANTYTGPTTITGGKLAVTGSLLSTGSVAITSGTLDGTGSVGNVTVANSAGNVIANGNTAGTTLFTASALTFGGAATTNIRTAGLGAKGITVTNALTTTPANGTVTLNVVNTGAFVNGANDLIGFGSFSGSIADFTLGSVTGSLSSRQSLGSLILDGNNIALNILGDSPKWTGKVSNVWSTAVVTSPKNWQLISAGTETDYLEGDTVLFDDSATGNTDIDVAAAGVSPTFTSFANGTLGYTLNSTGTLGVTGPGGLSKSGAGSLIVTNVNTYTGATLIAAGATLQLGDGTSGHDGTIANTSGVANAGTLVFNRFAASTAAYAISGAGNITVTGGSTQTFSGTNTFTGTTTVTGASKLSVATNANLGSATLGQAGVTLDNGTLTTTAGFTDTHAIAIGAGGGTINVNGAGQLYLPTADLLTGSGPLTLTGNGTVNSTGAGNLRIGATNSYSGAVTIQSGGSFEYGIAGAVGAAATFNVANQAELVTNSGVTLPNTVTVSGPANSIVSFENGNLGVVGGPITLNSNVIVGLRDWYNNATVRSGTISGIISGSGAVAVNSGTGSGGTLTLSGANTYDGSTTITASILAATNATALGTTVGGTVVNSGGVLDLRAAIGAEPVSIAGTGIASGGALITSTGSGSLGGAVTMTANSSIGGAGSLAIGGAIGDGGSAYALTKVGAGTTTLTGTNTYTGATTVSAGTLQIGDGSGSGTGSLSPSSNIAVATALVFNRTNAVTQGTDFSSVSITGAGSVNQFGAGSTLTFNTSNAYTGGTNIGAGQNGTVVRATASGALGTGTIAFDSGGNASTARFEVAGGSTLNNAIAFTGRGNASVGIESISGLNTLGGNIALGTGGSFYTIQSDANLLTLNGSITPPASGARTLALTGAGNGVANGNILLTAGGTLGIAKSGAGTWTLAGNNTYTGGTTVTDGKLVSANATKSFGTGTTAISGSGVVAGSGNTGGPVTVGTAVAGGGGTITAGSGTLLTDSIGAIASGPQTWNRSGTYVIKVAGKTAGSFDTMTIGGLLSLTSTGASDNKFTLSIINTAGTPAAFVAGSYKIASATSISTPAGTVLAATDLTNLFALNIDTFADTLGDFSVTAGLPNGGGSFNDVYLNYAPTPEPGTMMLVAFGATPLLSRRRRRHAARAV